MGTEKPAGWIVRLRYPLLVLMLALAAAAAPNILLDMSEVDYIASAGLRILKRLRGAVRSNGGTLTLRGVQDNVMDVFELTGFAAMLSFE